MVQNVEKLPKTNGSPSEGREERLIVESEGNNAKNRRELEKSLQSVRQNNNTQSDNAWDYTRDDISILNPQKISPIISLNPHKTLSQSDIVILKSVVPVTPLLDTFTQSSVTDFPSLAPNSTPNLSAHESMHHLSTVQKVVEGSKAEIKDGIVHEELSAAGAVDKGGQKDLPLAESSARTGTVASEKGTEGDNSHTFLERQRGIQSALAEKLAREQLDVGDPSKIPDDMWDTFLKKRNEVRIRMDLEPFPIITINDFKESTPKNYLDYLARNEFVIRNTDRGNIQGSVVDYDSYFMSPRLQKLLNDARAFTNTGNTVSVDGRSTTVKDVDIISGKTGEQNTVSVGGNKWDVNEIGWAYEPDGSVPWYAKEPQMFFHRTLENGDQVSFTAPANKIFQGGGFNANALVEYEKQSGRNHRSEQEGKALISGFDLPKDRPIGYIPINAPNDNATRGYTEGLSRYFPELMRESGYDVRSPKQSTHLDFKGNQSVAEAISNFIVQNRKEGIKDIVLYLNGHGDSERGMFFDNKNPEYVTGRLTKKQFREVLIKNPDMLFTIDTNACYNAGFSEVVMHLPKDVQSRVTFFAGTNNKNINYAGSVNGSNELAKMPEKRKAGYQSYQKNEAYTVESYYKMYLAKGLRDGKTYGAAHWYADQMVKKISGLDPESIYQGKLISENHKLGNEDDYS